MYKIVSKKGLCQNIFEFVLEARFIAKNYLPGQFIILRIYEKGERIPLTIVSCDREKGTIRIVVQKVGKTTGILSLLSETDSVLDVLGPLGRPFPVRNYGKVILVAGGVGLAVVYPVAEALKKAGNEIVLIYGVRSSEQVIMREDFLPFGIIPSMCSEDGSIGEKGLVTDILKRVIGNGERLVYTAGPIPMMKAVSGITKKNNIPAIASINSIMVDGMGMCGSCRVTLGSEIRFACVDGPDFDANLVDFGDLINRQNRFRDLEKKAFEEFEKDGNR